MVARIHIPCQDAPAYPTNRPSYSAVKAQFKLSLERICGGQGDARKERENEEVTASEALREKFARIPIFIAHRESTLLPTFMRTDRFD